MRLTELPGVVLIPCMLTILLLLMQSSACVTMQYPVQETYNLTENVTENRTEVYSQYLPVSKIVAGEYALTPDVTWSNSQLVFRGVKGIWYYGYNLGSLPPHDSEKIALLFLRQEYYEQAAVSVFDMRSQGQILAHPQISPSDTVSSTEVAAHWISAETGSSPSASWMNLANTKLNLAGTLAGISGVWSNSPGNRDFQIDSRGSREIAIIISGPLNPQNCRFYASLVWSDNLTEYKTVTSEHTVPFQVEKSIQKTRTVFQPRPVPFWEILLNK